MRLRVKHALAVFLVAFTGALILLINAYGLSPETLRNAGIISAALSIATTFNV